jgi:predicted nucleic acid-binding protein
VSVRGYLVDANHVTAWETASTAFMAKLGQKPPACLIYVSAITFGEIQWGLAVTTSTDTARRKQFETFVARELWPFVLDVSGPVATAYADILGRLWRKHPPAKTDTKTDAHLVSLGVDINDVWLVATAKERNLTVLTQDKMAHIRDVVPEVTFESWI